MNFFKFIINNRKSFSLKNKKELFFPPNDFLISRAGEEQPFGIMIGKLGFQTKKKITMECYNEQKGKVEKREITNNQSFGYFSDFIYREDINILALTQFKNNVIPQNLILKFINNELENYNLNAKHKTYMKMIMAKDFENIISNHELKKFMVNINKPNPINPDKIKNIINEFEESKSETIKKAYISNKYNLVLTNIMKESKYLSDYGYGDYKVTYKENGKDKTVSSKDRILKMKIDVSSKENFIKDFIEKTNKIFKSTQS